MLPVDAGLPVPAVVGQVLAEEDAEIVGEVALKAPRVEICVGAKRLWDDWPGTAWQQGMVETKRKKNPLT